MAAPDNWNPELETKYQVYVQRKHAKGLTPRDRPQWREVSNRWKHLKTLGDGFRNEMYAELGCRLERGYSVEFYRRSAELGGRYDDIAAAKLEVSLEIKYGGVNGKDALKQLEKDAERLRDKLAWRTIWLVQDLSKMPRSVRELQEELAREFPGRFLVREVSPAGRERVTEEVREMLRTREAVLAQDTVREITDQCEAVQYERDQHREYLRTHAEGRVLDPELGWRPMTDAETREFATFTLAETARSEQERELTAELALASERWMQIEQELTEVREQRASRERALDDAVERERHRRALEQSPHERELLAVAARELRQAHLNERAAYAQIWQTELQGLARREHAQAVTARDNAQQKYAELEKQVHQRLTQVSIEPVNREQLRDTIEKAAHQEKVLQQRTTAELTVLEQHFVQHTSREREAGAREYDPSVQRQRENTAVAIERNQARFQEMAKDIDREAFLAWSSAGLDETRVRHFEQDGHVYTEITREGKDSVTVRYDSKERELALAVTMAREGHHPTVITNTARASRDHTMPPGFALAAQREHDQRRRDEDRIRLLEQQRERGNARER